MIVPTKIYDCFPTLSPEESGGLRCDATRKPLTLPLTTLRSIAHLIYACSLEAQVFIASRSSHILPSRR